LRTTLFGQTSTPATIITYAGNDAIFAVPANPPPRQLVNPNLHSLDAQATSTFRQRPLMAQVSAGMRDFSVVAGNG